jgi:hypothetical protein
MTHAIPSSPSGARRSASREGGPSQYRDHGRSHRQRRAAREYYLLARYTDSEGRQRELVSRQGSGGSVLVLDRDAATHDDRRLLAHLAADEPAENAAIVCRHYLEDSPAKRRRCRALRSEDAHAVPFPPDQDAAVLPAAMLGEDEPRDTRGCAYGLMRLQTGMSIPELRWQRYRPECTDGELEPVSMREAIGSLESYEPVRALTLHALSLHRIDTSISTTVLRSELARVQGSPIVLNRRLREVTLAMIDRQELSMSEIAIRCGRMKHDRRGNASGETSWLARRLGLLPEGGQSTPTPWVHSDVLALIARRGLGISPREVELG